MNGTSEFVWLNNYLNGEEYVLWKGKPDTRRLLSGMDTVLIPFSLLWTGGLLHGLISSIDSGMPLFAWIFMAVFLAFGLYLTVGRFLHRRWLLQRTEYAVTNRRILIKRGRSVHIAYGTTLPPMSVYTHADGTGTISFKQVARTRSGYRYVSMGGLDTPNGDISLENLHDLRGAQAAINSMLSKD